MRQILSFCRRRHEKAQKQNETAGARRFPGNCLQEKLKNRQGTGKQNHGTLENQGVGRSRQARNGFRYQTRIAVSAAAAFMQIFPARAGFSPRAHGRPDGVPRGNFGAREESLH